MKPLIKVTDTLGDQVHIEFLRDLEEGDFKILEIPMPPASCVREGYSGDRFIAKVSAGWTISATQELIDHLCEACKFKVEPRRVSINRSQEPRPMFEREGSLDPLTSGWYAEPQRHYCHFEEDVQYQGAKVADIEERQKRYDKARDKVLAHFVKGKDAAIKTKLTYLTNALRKNLERRVNGEFLEQLRRIVVDLQISHTWMEKHGGQYVKQLEGEVEEISEQIKELREKRKDAETKLFAEQRRVLVANLTGEKSDFSEHMKKEVLRMANEAPEIPESRRRLFG